MMKLFQALLPCLMRLVGSGLLVLVVVGCGSLQVSDPANPDNPYMFPGQAQAGPNAVSSQPPVPAPAVSQPAGMAPAPPVTAAALTPAPALPTSGSENHATPSPTVFRPGDSFIVSFSDLPLPGLLPVNVELAEDGKVTLHHNVSVNALGKTARQLEQEIRSEYVPKYYKYLTITIRTEMRFFHVNGEVKMPAQYPWRGEMRLLSAIAQAGGFTDWARRTKVQVTRPNAETVIVDCKKAQKDPSKDVPVYPGDYINVPRRPWYIPF